MNMQAESVKLLVWFFALAFYSYLVLPFAQLLSMMVAGGTAVWISSTLLLFFCSCVLRRFVVRWASFVVIFTAIPMTYVFGFRLRYSYPSSFWQDRLISSFSNPQTRAALLALLFAPLIVGVVAHLMRTRNK